MDIKEEAILGEHLARHWYYVSKGRAMRDLIRGVQTSEVLDVGAGSGVFSRQLLDAGVCKRALCVDPHYAEESDEIYAGGAIRFRHEAGPINQGLILMMDVLEHVEDDLALLRLYTDPMPIGAKLLISVPAFQFLWSEHDEFLEHFRRYKLAEVEQLVRNAGLRIGRSRYFFGALFPLIAAIRWGRGRTARSANADSAPKSDLRPASPTVNTALTAIHDIERKVMLPWNRTAGLTVFCLAEKT
ncbi:MAG: class I SAM-dependent methyltransferase [Gammaproteobacteria bacterium]|nr:class I SAM-dependent methyltransferase [Gammaproteobacteria bacterium]